jgi:hypothetical protein
MALRALLLLPLLLAPTRDNSALTLPDGPAAKVWAGVGPDTQPAELPPEARLGLDPWNQPATWKRWAELVRLEEQTNDPARRAELCLLAKAHGRASDAWHHYQALGADPTWVAAVTPSLLPGVPAGSPVAPGGRAAPLPDGVLLTPFLPPTSRRGAVEWRTATVHGLTIGEAVLDLTITVEATGVQVDLAHVSGGAAKVSVLLPEPEGFQIRVEYVDWLRRDNDQIRTPITVELKPGEEPRQLYGRVLEQRSHLPTGAARKLPASLLLGGLVFEVPADDPQRADLARIAGVIGELLQVETRVDTPGAPRPEWSCTVFRLPPGHERLERLRYLASAIEAYLLEKTPR